jgi:hypothetical protein
MRDRDHDISLLVPLLNVLEGFRDLFQRITSVDDRLELPSRGKFCDEIHSFRVFHGHAALEFLTPGNGCPNDPRDVGQTDDVLKKDTVGL